MLRRSQISRRGFVANVGSLASLSLGGCAAQSPATTPMPEPPSVARGEYDLSWIPRVTRATDRAVFDWPSIGPPEESIVLQIVARYLDNCAAAYAADTYTAVAVMNIRTMAIPAAMNDAAWARYELGAEYKLIDSTTRANAVRNVFWGQSASAPDVSGVQLLDGLVRRGAIILVCDFAMGHLAARLAANAKRSADEVHRDLRSSLVPNAYAVPSGIFGLARSQNAGCAFIRM